MAKLEDIKTGTLIGGLIPGKVVDIVSDNWHGSDIKEVVFKDPDGNVNNRLLYRDDEANLEIVERGQQWNFDADGHLLRLVSEAKRIRLAYLFDPHLAIHTSVIEPLPHQITAVYGEMLPRQPLRFLLADDPGAGKTIMAGLYIKELLIRGDLKRCLIICPGNLVEQWQDELYSKFKLPFEILTNDRLETARTGNAFTEIPLCIARLDKLARDERAQLKLKETEWDLIVCDEAHKMSAAFFGGEIKETKRHKLGKMLIPLCRHFLLMTATPHNGKEEDFQLFMSLLDPDRFEGRFREGIHLTDASDMMRRMVKENLLKFDGTPLFPERKAYTVPYPLSDGEARLYKEVTEYVREQFNRAEQLENDRRKGTVGFALTILQRRLASSPEAIYRSLNRRRERLEKRVREEELMRRGAEDRPDWLPELPEFTEEDFEDLDDAPAEEIEDLEEQIVDQATAAQTITELLAEIEAVKKLETLAYEVRRSGTDRKWEELSKILQEKSVMVDGDGNSNKLIIFTEHRDTLNYLANRIQSLLGKSEVIEVIHGALARDVRKRAQELFLNDPDVQILIATDAAAEGVNLQQAHLMVNYDLPWNPNRIEQRFGRIHRIGQTEVCHLWNLVAHETREGSVYETLLRKLDVEREALGGAVFDVLGQAISGKELRTLMIEAIRYGEQPEVRERLNEVVEGALDYDRLQALIEEQALVHETMGASQVRKVREEMERIEAKRLQPHYVAAFFIEAFQNLGGTIRQRELRRYEIRNVPAQIRTRAMVIGLGVDSVLKRYDRVCFDKGDISIPGKRVAEFLCPGHPLLEAVSDLILEKYGSLLKQGAILIDEADEGEKARALFYLEHSIEDARKDSSGVQRVASRRFQFVENSEDGRVTSGGIAPYLDYRPASEAERDVVKDNLDDQWDGEELEKRTRTYAIETLVPSHLQEVRQYREKRIEKTKKAVHERLTKEITYWDNRAQQLKEEELAGKPNARINSGKARGRAEDLADRLKERMEELEHELTLSPKPPVVLGGALIIPLGLLRRWQGEPSDAGAGVFGGQNRDEVERLAMEAVIELEKRLGFQPTDVSEQKCGYDVESLIPDTGKLRFIEVKGRAEGAPTVTITKNEILTGLNKPDDYYLAIVLVSDGGAQPPMYVINPFEREPDFGVTSVNYNLNELLAKGSTPQ